ncbi:hypothetical protein CNBG_3508 [Cryptococcus deuterogattii R265]|uniref:Arrestin C-terminal-like domain-containing protein n=1 Tax=Cryptococcus deuterogattii (strain R265) TaxID=294750 RepID=A0A095CAT8_CRYD2|nr:hypothetical protein CNBG_3508 [Cryptococcus deuterogattii R265]KIR30428.1 hypothetical protein I309_00565 [Cryptococcus deuterogattii LA55]KIR36910.1 hypothetical protein I352_00222 [Cryptococcus deuterogattii MMRL2647]KIR74714.1 hypothetical protein I310_00988 [Cryptococcus deuterogattii CA1014]KIR92359.1 hypothetical protein I304_03763 [Cryptococcus deuterogattii CBS 10090]KIS01525.1 hypothetical protein L804_01403 [Cryptococcus deuterogattii 2001/935-1]
MPSRWIPSGFTTPSAPSSRASSPTRNGPAPRSADMLSSRRRDGTVDSGELGDYFSAQPSPVYDASAPISPSLWSGPATPSAMSTPGGSSGHTLEIVLDSDQLVLRGQGGDMNPAYLSGRVELNLLEATNIKEIMMSLTGKAKVQFSDGSGTSSKHRHYSHLITSHDWSFLQGDRGHSHTLKAGRHTFHFTHTLDGNLPSTLRTYSGDALIVYKLRAVVVRSGFASNFSATKEFKLSRMFTPEALEFNQTLEIENTWPGKVMYSLTLPYKAYAAGDEIPVNIKFMPLAKGVRVTTVVSVLKEYTLVHTKHSSHPDTRVDSCVKHEIRRGQAKEIAREPIRPPQHWVDSHGHSSRSSANTSRHPSPSQTPVVNSRARLPTTTWGARPRDSYFPGQTSDAPEQAQAGPSSSRDSVSITESTETDIEVGDEEVDTFFNVPIPAWVTPSHSIHPVFITHKIKWACSIANPDGHVSELRCALPILILDHSLLNEARSAGASTRGLLFGNTQPEEPQVDLPSYSNHVYDRVAIADSSTPAGWISRSINPTPLHSPHDDTPPRSRAPSRPGSPTRGRSGDSTPEVPPRRQLSQFVDSELLLSLGALRTHSTDTSPHSTPPDSLAPSRTLSRRNSRSNLSSRVSSRPGSRAGSRASSPERGSQPSSTSGSYVEEAHLRPGYERHRSSGLHGLFHLPLKPMRPLSHLGGGHISRPILRNGNQSNINLSAADDVIPRNSSVPGSLNSTGASNSGMQSSASSQNHVSFASHAITFEPDRSSTRFEVGAPDTPSETEDDIDPLMQVPSYDIASRGFLGGGVVPIDTRLPTYDASEMSMHRTRSGTDLGSSGSLVRPRSDSALVQLGAQAAAEAEERANDDADDTGAPAGA